MDSFGGVRGPLSTVGFGFTGLLVTGVGDLDIDLLDSDPDSDSEESCDACFGVLSSSPSFCFTSAVALLLLDELECSLADEAEPDRERDLDREPDRDPDGDLDGVCDTERDREREAECEEERDSDPERERDREDRDESEEDEDDRLLELAEDTECRLGEVVLCHGSIHSSFGNLELEIPSALVFNLSFSKVALSFNSILLSVSVLGFISSSSLFSGIFIFPLSSASNFLCSALISCRCCFTSVLTSSFSLAIFSSAISLSFFPCCVDCFSSAVSLSFSFCFLTFSSRFPSDSLFTGLFTCSLSRSLVVSLVFAFGLSLSPVLRLFLLSLRTQNIYNHEVSFKGINQVNNLLW